MTAELIGAAFPGAEVIEDHGQGAELDAVSALMTAGRRVAVRYPRRGGGDPVAEIPARMSASGRQVTERLTWWLDGAAVSAAQVLAAAAELGPPGAAWTLTPAPRNGPSAARSATLSAPHGSAGQTCAGPVAAVSAPPDAPSPASGPVVVRDGVLYVNGAAVASGVDPAAVVVLGRRVCVAGRPVAELAA